MEAAGPGPGDAREGTTGPSLPGRATLCLALAAASLGCADTVRPVLGGLRIGARSTAFHMPVLESQRLPFEYPRDAWREGIGGETVLKIRISADGTVDSVRVVRSSGHRSLDSAAVAGARRLRYRPARHGGEPIQVWGILPVRYPMPAGVRRDR